MQYVKISELELWDKNPRFITNENFEKLKKSITDDPKFLEKRPILVSKVNWKMIVYWWNQRLKAMQDLWREEAPVDIEENIDENLMIERAFKDNMEYGKFDNKIISDDFDKELLLSFDLPSDELNIDGIFWSDIDFDDIEWNQDREKSKKMQKVVCPECSNEFIL